ncbi:stage V sporulation protein R [Caldanaerobius fijiensis DSM 17918]|uniref:Stage V sporulation protein R n=1 Tax=Caldanaerobius fijiensis DSM 17918 TaxID=1121256 RepID=A0A1M4UU76_9THEO|nr:SpoVR family protein [Caldanaerobius fijiensis]SHE60244.1 stage V sporulation protein R [Caldanaerobius fijiensis DSM 17918]
MDYSIEELEYWDDMIERKARDMGLDFYPQEFELVNYENMLGYEAYGGMPSRYPHWSFGKAYERLKTFYTYNLTGLPYEMVINSNPCIAYLMKENTLLLQILTMAHVYAHNDFFKNNRLFKEGTDAEMTLEMFKNHADRVRRYIANPNIGYEGVEKLLNAAHAIRFQIPRVIGEKRNKAMEKSRDLKRVPMEPEDDLLYFLREYGELEEWQRDILEIVEEETRHFIPQIETKIMNEGWASFWHYKILNSMNLPQDLYMEFLDRHNQVVAPVQGAINPYYIGFKMYMDIEKRYGLDKVFEVRSFDRDQSFLRRYLTYELIHDLNLFEYVREGKDIVITEVADDKGWEKIRNTLSDTAGMGAIPYIRVVEMSDKDRTLTLEHVYDGRELELNYACETLKHIVDIWGHKVVLKTLLEGKVKEILCDESKNISLT